MREGETNARGPAPAVTTAVRLLDALAARRGAASLDELTRAVAEPRSSVHRVLTTLVAENIVHRTEARGGYRLGPKLVEWGSAYLNGIDLFDEFHRVARSIVSELNETVQLEILDWPDAVRVAKVDSSRQVRLVTDIGGRVPAHACAGGKVLLSFHPELVSRYGTLTPLTANTITSLRSLRTELDQVREAGLAEETQEAAETLCGLAAPVCGRDGSGVVAALSICVATTCIEPGYRKILTDSVRGGAEELSRRFGAQLGGHG
jgi:DNA-binding IclR family transcriptional regulator